jgi:hypothetical protein
MAATNLLLTGIDAFVAQVISPTKVRFSINENDFAANHLIEVDLAKNPQTVQPGSWATDVDCDFQTTGGYTTIGPTFHSGAHVGGVYLAQRLVTQYASVLSGWPGPPDEIYQYQALLRSDNGTVTRFHGFKVRVLGASVGTLAHVAFIRAGTPSASAGRPRWIDLADATTYDPQANGFTTIGPASAAGTVGTLFVSSAKLRDGGDDIPKYPRTFGW